MYDQNLELVSGPIRCHRCGIDMKRKAEISFVSWYSDPVSIYKCKKCGEERRFVNERKAFDYLGGKDEY